MNKEANMKTILEIAKECGAYQPKDWYAPVLSPCNIIFEDESELIATIEAWNRQNSEPVYQVNMGNAYYDCDKERYEKSIYGDKRIVYLAPQQPQNSEQVGEVAHLNELNDVWISTLPVGTKLFTAPPQPQTVKEALEKAAKFCEDRYHFSNAKEIRALIDQPEPPASQELMDRIAKLEKTIKDIIDLTDSKFIIKTCNKALQSKPAKG